MTSTWRSLKQFEKTFPNLSMIQKASILLGSTYCNYSPIVRGKGLIQRNFIRSRLPQENVTLRDFTGNELITAPRGAIGQSLIQRGEFERAEIACIASILRTEGGALIDIGANIGAVSCAVARLVDCSTVYALEPFLPNFDLLQLNVVNNGLTNNVSALQVAVGAPGVSVDMVVGSDPAMTMKMKGGLSGGLPPAMRRQMGHQLTSTRLTLRALDELWDEWGNPAVSFLKIDVDGGDFEVLAHAHSTIVSNRPWVLIEVIDPEILSALTQWAAQYRYLLLKPETFTEWNWLLAPMQTSSATSTGRTNARPSKA